MFANFWYQNILNKIRSSYKNSYRIRNEFWTKVLGEFHKHTFRNSYETLNFFCSQKLWIFCFQTYLHANHVFTVIVLYSKFLTEFRTNSDSIRWEFWTFYLSIRRKKRVYYQSRIFSCSIVLQPNGRMNYWIMKN